MVKYSKVEIRLRLAIRYMDFREIIHTLNHRKSRAVAPVNMNIAAVINIDNFTDRPFGYGIGVFHMVQDNFCSHWIFFTQSRKLLFIR